MGKVCVIKLYIFYISGFKLLADKKKSFNVN